MISVAIVTNCTAWLTQIMALALPLLSAASSCLFNKQSRRRRRERKAERGGEQRGEGRDWWRVRRTGALWPRSNVYPLNHSKSHLPPSAPPSALHEKHYLSAGAIIHRWLPPSQQPATMHFQHWVLCVWVFVCVLVCVCVCLLVWPCEWSRKFREEENKRKRICLHIDFFVPSYLCV